MSAREMTMQYDCTDRDRTRRSRSCRQDVLALQRGPERRAAPDGACAVELVGQDDTVDEVGQHRRPRPVAHPHRHGGPPPVATDGAHGVAPGRGARSEEHTSELQSLMRISYAVFCLKKKK